MLVFRQSKLNFLDNHLALETFLAVDYCLSKVFLSVVKIMHYSSSGYQTCPLVFSAGNKRCQPEWLLVTLSYRTQVSGQELLILGLLTQEEFSP